MKLKTAFRRLPMKRLLFILCALCLINSALIITSAHAVGRFVDLNDGTVFDTQSKVNGKI